MSIDIYIVFIFVYQAREAFDSDVLCAAACGDVRSLELALASANVNVCDRSGQSTLHRATCGGHVRAMRMLLEHGAHVNAADKVLQLFRMQCATAL